MPKRIDDNQINPVVESEADKLHRVTRAALAAIPGVGGTLVEAFNALISPPLEKRKSEWMAQVTEGENRYKP